MANKLFYIPLEIGAWLKDTSCVSMDVQGCLLNLIFKLWDSSAKGLLSISFSQLSILWRKSIPECQKIVAEMQQNDLLNIEILPENMVKFESRRMTKEAFKSLKMSQNGSKGGRPKKQKESKLKANNKAKIKQSLEYDSYSNSDFKLNEKEGMGGKTKFNPLDHIPDNWNGDLFAVEWDDFMKMRKKKGWSCSEKVLITRLRQLRELSKDVWGIASQIMQKSTERNYAEFFPIDSQKNGSPKQPDHDPRHSSTFKFDKA